MAVFRLGRFLAAVLLFALAPVLLSAQTDAPATPPAPGSGLVEGATTLPTTQTSVQAGLYVLRLGNVSPRDGSFDVDMWVWFRWTGSDIRPDQSFELANGVISNRSEAEVIDDHGTNYASVRVQATIYQEFDVRRYPLDNHELRIQIEDENLDVSQLDYVVDQGIALDPGVKVAGWRVALEPAKVERHLYPTDYGYHGEGQSASTYSRFTVPISLTRTSYGQLFKQFWASVLAVALGLLAFRVHSDDLDARFGLGVGSIFAASANAFVITSDLPKTTVVTLAEQLNLLAVGAIFISVFLSIWSLRLRYLGRPEASERLDDRSLLILGALYIVLNVLVLSFDLSW